MLAAAVSSASRSLKGTNRSVSSTLPASLLPASRSGSVSLCSWPSAKSCRPLMVLPSGSSALPMSASSTRTVSRCLAGLLLAARQPRRGGEGWGGRAGRHRFDEARKVLLCHCAGQFGPVAWTSTQQQPGGRAHVRKILKDSSHRGLEVMATTVVLEELLPTETTTYGSQVLNHCTGSCQQAESHQLGSRVQRCLGLGLCRQAPEGSAVLGAVRRLKQPQLHMAWPQLRC